MRLWLHSRTFSGGASIICSKSIFDSEKQKRVGVSDVKQLTGLMSLANEAMKSSLLTCSLSAVSMFTSTVLLAYKHTQTQIKVERGQKMSHVHSWMNSVAPANETHYMKYCTFGLHNDSTHSVLPHSRKVISRGGGREKTAFRGVKRNVKASRHE